MFVCLPYSVLTDACECGGRSQKNPALLERLAMLDFRDRPSRLNASVRTPRVSVYDIFREPHDFWPRYSASLDQVCRSRSWARIQGHMRKTLLSVDARYAIRQAYVLSSYLASLRLNFSSLFLLQLFDLLWICCGQIESLKQVHNKSNRWSLRTTCCGLVVAFEPITEESWHDVIQSLPTPTVVRGSGSCLLVCLFTARYLKNRCS